MAQNHDSSETSRLLDLVRRGRPEFDRLFARHRSALKAAIELRISPALRKRLDASDIVQETYSEAFQRLDDYLQRVPMPFRLWIRKTAQQRLNRERRFHVGAAQRSVTRELPLPDQSSVALGQGLLASGKSPSQQMRADDVAQRVRQAMAQLSEADQEILLMRTYEGLSYEEIACVLEIDPAAARKRNGRALIRLHSLLSRYGVTESRI